MHYYTKFTALFTILVLISISALGSVSAAGNNTTVNETNSSGLADSDWPSFQNNANKTGQSNYTGPQTNTTKWTYGNITVYGSAVIGDNGTVYVAGTDGILYTFSSVGELLWTWTTRSGIYGSPAIGSDGTVYISNWMNSTTYAISSTGELIWKCTTGGYNFGSSPVIGSDGTVYVSATDDSNGTLYAIDSEGNIKWSYVMGMIYGTSPVIGSDGTIYMTDYDGVIYALTQEGNLNWSYTLRYNLGGVNYYVNIYYNSLSLGDDGTIYITAHNGRYIRSKDPVRSNDEIRSSIGLVYALVDKGTECWEDWSYNFGEAVYGVPTISSDGTVYVVSASGLNALDSDGNLLWTYSTGVTSDSGLTSAVVGADGVIYFGSDNGFYAINPDGSLLWSYSMDGVLGSPAIGSDGTLYIGSDDTFYAFNDLTANLTMDYVDGTVLSVQFTGDTTGTAESWEWDFGDGTTSTEQNPTHTYNEAGVYKVTLVAVLEDGSTVTKIEKMTIVEQDIVAPTVTSDNGGGKYEDTQYVTLSAVDDSDTVIYYTIDGSDPLTSDTRRVYSGSLAVNDSMTLKYAAVDSSGNWSPVYTEEYVIVDVVYVDSASNYDSNTINEDIQAILDNAASGSKIIFKGTSYSDLQLIINKQLDIISNVGTTITTDSSGSAVFLFNGADASGSSITGFTIVSTDSGILVNGADAVTISDVQVTSSDGTAITVKESDDTTIEDSTFENSQIGVYIYNCSNILVNKSTITGNEKKGVMIDNSSNITITNLSITDNGEDSSTAVDDGGIYVTDSDQVDISNNEIDDNFMGISTNNVSNLTIDDNTINDNFVDGIYLTGYAKDITIKSNTIKRNSNGIAIDYNDGENISISGNEIAESIRRNDEIKIDSGVDWFTSGDGITFGINYITAEDGSESIKHNAIYNNDYRDVDAHDEKYHDDEENMLDVGSNVYTYDVVSIDTKFCCKIRSNAAQLTITRTGTNEYTAYFIDGDTGEIITDLPNIDITITINNKEYSVSTVDGKATITVSTSDLISQITADFNNNHASTSALSEVTAEINLDILEGFIDQTTSGDTTSGDSSGGTSDSGSDGSGGTSGSGSSSGSSSSDGTSTGTLSLGAAAAASDSSAGSSTGQDGSSSGQDDSSSGQEESSETVQELILNQDPSLWGILAIIIIVILVTGAYYRNDITKMIKKSRK